MNFFTNKIVNPVGEKISFDEWLKKQASQFEKTAEEDKKWNFETKDDDDKKDDSDTEEKSENSDKEEDKEEKKVEAKCGKEMGESANAGKITEKHTEAAPGDDENPEPKVLINNDPNYQKPMKKKEASVKFKKIASLNRHEKLQLFASLTSVKSNPVQYAEAMTGIKFANLTAEEKSWFVSYWETLYPPEYVKSMAEDR